MQDFTVNPCTERPGRGRWSIQNCSAGANLDVQKTISEWQTDLDPSNFVANPQPVKEGKEEAKEAWPRPCWTKMLKYYCTLAYLCTVHNWPPQMKAWSYLWVAMWINACSLYYKRIASYLNNWTKSAVDLQFHIKSLVTDNGNGSHSWQYLMLRAVDCIPNITGWWCCWSTQSFPTVQKNVLMQCTPQSNVWTCWEQIAD